MSTGCAGFPPAVRADRRRRRASIPPPLTRGSPLPAGPATRPAVPRANGSTPPMAPRIVTSPPPLVRLLALLVLAWCSPAPHACRAALAPARALGAQPPPPTAAATAVGTAGVGEAPRRSSPLRVAQCRARCLQRCWENCELLQSNYAVWGAMCSEKGICFPGCQQACSFHQEEERWGGENRQMVPVVHTRGHQVVQVVVMTSEGGSALVFVRWPARPSRPPRSANVVYVLMTRAQGAASWMQVTQTVDLEARLGDSPSAAHHLDIRVLVVGPEGLVTIYSPADGQSLSSPSPTPATLHPRALSSPPPDRPSPRDAPQGEGQAGGQGGWPLIIREAVTSPLDDAQLALLFPTASADQVVARQQQPPSGPWVLHEMSLIHQRVLVIAEVSWEARRGGGVYLVTWEVDGGGLKGNLFTQTTSVTLSLWPLTLYHIQVEVASRTPGDPQPPDRSQVLHLDTRRAAPVMLADPQQVV
ncbi:uncharacterized protein, partial [Hetaerina americana]|uniref:uncharacterized protein n=1 Tax=Hetaerina americana TaxID=62018 RepID=UPI003A7F4F84